MGNCIRHENSAAAVWAGDDWGSLSSKHGDEDEGDTEQERLFAQENPESNSSPSSQSCREVKIKITKKELKELVKSVNMEGLSLEQVLTRLTSMSGHSVHGFEAEDHAHRPWRPVLQSIPEVN